MVSLYWVFGIFWNIYPLSHLDDLAGANPFAQVATSEVWDMGVGKESLKNPPVSHARGG
jgi:hypothetical protein